MQQSTPATVPAPRESTNRYSMQTFIRKYHINNYRHLQYMRMQVMENVIFDVLENDINRHRDLMKVKGWPAQVRQFAIIKEKYVKIKSRERPKVQLA